MTGALSVRIVAGLQPSFSALTDIDFDSLTWGNIVRRFLDAKNDPVKLRTYLNTQLCLAEPGRVIAAAGAKESLQTTDRVWPVKVNAKNGRPLYCLYFDHNFWACRLYRETIQHFDPKRHRPYAPATYFATDTGDDYFQELMKEHEVWKNRKTIREKVSQSAVNDFGDCEKIGLVQDWCVRMSREDTNYLLKAGNQAVPQTE